MMKWGAALAMLSTLAAQKEPEQGFVETTPVLQARIERGLAALARMQSRNGAFGNGTVPVAATSLSGLAFLAAGHTPGRGQYSDKVKGCVDYILRMTTKTGYINEGAMRGAGGSGMHGHGYAMLFLSQVYGMADGMEPGDMDRIKDALSRAVRVTEQAQSPNGGWIYDPTPSGDEGSVTITQVQALRATQNAGIRVNTKTVEKAIEYINKTTSDDGITAYSLGQRMGGGGGSPSLTAAGMCVLTYLGQYDNPKIPKGLSFVMRSIKPRSGVAGNFSFYANYYATVAMYQGGGKYWREWWPAYRDEMIRTQSGDGSWPSGEGQQYGAAFSTALGLLSLQVPNRYLPIFQRRQD